MTRTYYPTPDQTTLRSDIPTITWLRLRWHRRVNGIDMPQAVSAVLKAGLDALGVPSEPDKLLGPSSLISPQARN